MTKKASEPKEPGVTVRLPATLYRRVLDATSVQRTTFKAFCAEALAHELARLEREPLFREALDAMARTRSPGKP